MAVGRGRDEWAVFDGGSVSSSARLAAMQLSLTKLSVAGSDSGLIGLRDDYGSTARASDFDRIF